jgi:hypothetical protein
MDHQSIISAIDVEIAKLQQARTLLLNSTDSGSARGTHVATPRMAAKRKTRILSPEARKRIADSQRKRWAAAKKQKKSAALRSMRAEVHKPVHKEPSRPAKEAKKTTPTAKAEATATG